jgi:hypothetical protein
MSCPCCDHTLAQIVPGVAHCERCGTLVTETDVYTPKLVERCRRFRNSVGEVVGFGSSELDMKRLWHRLGIEESIALPQERRVT